MTDKTNDIRQEFLDGVMTALPATQAPNSRAEIFGWTPQAMKNLMNAERIIITLPHASPNVFFLECCPTGMQVGCAGKVAQYTCGLC